MIKQRSRPLEQIKRICCSLLHMRRFQRVMVGLVICLILLCIWSFQSPQRHTGIQSAISCKNKIAQMAIPKEAQRINYIAALGNDVIAIEKEYFTFVEMLTHSCFTQKQLGPEGDGGWQVCLDREYDITPPCLVYSFGVADEDFLFEKAVEEQLGCEVHAFDPSMGLESHKFSTNGYFHNMGIDSADTYAKDNQWRMRRLKTIMSELGHTGRHIDLLKMDVEFSEWLALYDIIKSNMLQYIRQIAMETHTPEMDVHTRPDHQCTWCTRETLAFMLKTLINLRNAGFNLFYSSTNYRTKFMSGLTGQERYCCHNLHFVNTKHEENVFRGRDP